MILSQKQMLPAWTSVLGMLIVTGCASSKVTMLPDGGPTTQEIYDQHISGSTGASTNAENATQWHATLQQSRPQSDWSRSAKQNLDADFQRVPNPELTGYVFPHLTRHGYPIPGYMTRFSLYEKNAYALPGEMPVPLPGKAVEEKRP